LSHLAIDRSADDRRHVLRRWSEIIGRTVVATSRARPESVPEGHGNAGEYQLLYKYLRDRYADRVVLTFAEIEDLLGFSLPASARLQQEWWSGADAVARRSAQADSWTLASRTATVNLSAQSVLFERHS
jgi:hypothetical protein